MSEGRIPPAGSADDELVELLTSARPAPPAALRGELRRALVAAGADRLSCRPPALRLKVAAYLAIGGVLLGIAAAGAAGHGPLDLPPNAGSPGPGHAAPR